MPIIRVDLDGRGEMIIRATENTESAEFIAPDGRRYRLTAEEANAARYAAGRLMTDLARLLED